MDDVLTAIDGSVAECGVLDVAFVEAEALPLGFRDEVLDLVKIALVTGDEIVESDNFLVMGEKGFEDVRSDESRAAGDQPFLSALPEGREWRVASR